VFGSGRSVPRHGEIAAAILDETTGFDLD